MSEAGLSVLLDQNVPAAVAEWLRQQRPEWRISHVNETGLQGLADAEVYRWAQAHGAVIVTYDEDFADARFYQLGQHHGVVRLRVWPTTIEMTILALSRLLCDVPERDWLGSLIIVANSKIRLRHVGAHEPQD